MTRKFETLGMAATSYLTGPSGRSLKDNNFVKNVRLSTDFYDPSDLSTVEEGRERIVQINWYSHIIYHYA